MKEDYIWSDYFKDYGKTKVFKTTKDYFEYIKNNGKNPCIVLKNTYDKNNKPTIIFDKIANMNNTNLVYTDEDNPIVSFEYTINGKKQSITFVNDIYFYMHQDEFIMQEQEIIKNRILGNKLPKNIYINSYLLTNEFINFLNESSDRLSNTTLIINKIYGSKTNAKSLQNIKYKLLSSFDNKIFGSYRLMELPTLDVCEITIPTYKEDFRYLNYLTQNAIIVFNKNILCGEEEYYEYIKQIFKLLDKNTHYNITVNVDNREKLSKSKLLDLVPNNVNLRINNYKEKYKLNEYKDNDKKIEEFIEYIKKSDLTEFEKYIEAYNFVSNYKDVNPTKSYFRNDLERSRSLKYILDNKYIVCVGYSKLLLAILDKLEIPCYMIHTDVYDNIKEDDKSNGHRRLMVKIKDEKYDIDGIYLCDPTFENSLGKKSLVYSLMTFDDVKSKYKVESLQIYDLLLDFHNKNEFYRKINYLIKQNSTSSFNNVSTSIFNTILEYLERLDYSKYEYFKDKYSIYFNKIISEEKLYNEFKNMLDEYYEYIINLINKSVKNNTKLSALYNNEEKFTGREMDSETRKDTKLESIFNEIKRFPLSYNEKEDKLELCSYEVKFYKDDIVVDSVIVHSEPELYMVLLKAASNKYKAQVNRIIPNKKL